MENSNPSKDQNKNNIKNQPIQQKRRARSQRFSRAKTGCFTCRARRKKCDETRDEKTGSCQRCLKSGIECLGFPSLRNAPLAAHSKKQKADQNEERPQPLNQTNFRNNRIMALSQNIDEQSGVNNNMLINSTASNQQGFDPSSRRPNQTLIPPTDPFIQPTSADQSTNFEFSLSDFMNSDMNAMFHNGQNKIASGSGTPLRPATPSTGILHVLDSMLNSKNNKPSSSSNLIREDQESFTFPISSASPLPQFLEDWVPSNIFENLQFHKTIQGSFEECDPKVRFPSPFPGIRDEESALKSLATFYSAFCMSWWLPRRNMRSKRRNFQHVVNAMERRLRRSEIACTTVAAVAACYGFGISTTHFDNTIIEPFRQSWKGIYEVVCDSKTSSLCAYLDWLGASTTASTSSSNGELEDRIEHHPKRLRSNSTSDQSEGESEDTFTSLAFNNLPRDHHIEAQADNLFSFASKVLAKVATAAKQDQSISDDILAPLEFAALVHVDVYLQAAMDLALFAFASRPEQMFHREFDAAGSLLESLLGRGQCVRLSEIDGIEAVGFRTFAWTDITNSVLSARCTRLHYLLEEPGKVNEQQRQQQNDVSQPESANITADEEEQGGNKKRKKDMDLLRNIGTNNGNGSGSGRNRGISISFGCPDDILVIFAHIANLHFQLRQARLTGSIKGNGAESLPAWALHTAHDLTRRIEESEKIAAIQSNNPIESNNQDRSRIRFEEGQKRLAEMWRHAAIIFLQTIAYRIGPLGKTNQERMKGIIELWNSSDMELNLIENGNPAMPMLFAAFIAQQKNEREICKEALRRIGEHEQSRKGYRAFVEKLWRETDERGFALLWHDVLDEEWANKIAIM